MSDFVDQQRWTPKRKAALLAMIEAGDMAPGALADLGLSQEELTAWRRNYSDHGIDGLYVCSLHYHQPNRRRTKHRRHRF